MTFEFWFTASLLIIMTILLVLEIWKPEIVIFGVLLLFAAAGVISPQEAFTGFSNHGMLTVGGLFVVAAALQRCGSLTLLEKYVLANKGPFSFRLLKTFLPISTLSAFFNNTPIVAMFIPILRSWARRNDYSISKVMIPLSYASILGGMCTLIGTSTTLVVHGMLLENDLPGYSFFEISKFGVPMAAVGLLFLTFVAIRLLPNRKEPMVQLGENTREFVVEMKVEKDYQYIGKTVQEAGLRRLKGLYLFQIERNGQIIMPLTPEKKILKDDRLFFTGLPETIIELQKTPGLLLLKDASFDLKDYDTDKLQPFEVVVSSHSPLIGKSVKDSDFRSHYNAVILAVHRAGGRIERKIGDIVIRAGDTLLILARHTFIKDWYHSKDFYLVSKTSTPPSKPKRFVWIGIVIFTAMIVAMALKSIPIIIAVAMAALLLVATKCINLEDAFASIDTGVLIIIASAFGISRAMSNSGVSDVCANFIINHLSIFGTLGLLIGVYAMTSLYTEIITNNAAAAFIFPIALSVADQAGLDSRPFIIALTLAASASFATPIGYQTNLMVYGPGGYRFRDFIKIGLPMNVLLGIIAVALLYWFYF